MEFNKWLGESEGVRARRQPEGGRLRSSDAEDFGPTVRADSRDGGLAVLERHVLRVLNLHARLALDAIGFSHLSLSFLSTERILRAHSCSLILTVAQMY